MAVGLNQRALLDQLNQSPLQQGLANNSGVRSPTLPNEQAAPFTPRGTAANFSDGTPSGFTSYAGSAPRDLSDPFFQGSAAERAQGASAFADFQQGRGQAVPTSSYSAARDSGLAPTPGATAAPAVTAPAADYSGQLEGFNADKLAANKNDPKYRFASIAKGFNVQDPAGRQALSDALAADTSGFFKGGLNGDMISALDPATGQYGNVDVIRGLDAGGQGWQWGAEGPGGGAGAPSAAQGMAVPQAGNVGMDMAQAGLAQQLQGSPYANIQSALGKFQQPNLEALLAQLGGR